LSICISVLLEACWRNPHGRDEFVAVMAPAWIRGPQG
jgi:hypothetical protein